MARLTTCGIIVTDTELVLLGHATRSPRWDIPKGLVEPAEDFRTAVVRELEEETGLVVAPQHIVDLGVHAYMPAKDLALFAWIPDRLPVPEHLVCRSTFMLKNGAELPELDRFAFFSWEIALTRVGKNLARVLSAVQPTVMRLRNERPCTQKRAS